MMQLFSRLMKLPLEAFVYSMEMFVYTMRGIQRIAYQGIDVMSDGDVRATVEAPGSESALPEETHAVPEGAGMGYREATQITMQEEERHMADKDLRDDMLKLVRYKILFVKREYEYAFPEEEELVSDNTDAAAYTAWKIAHFIQRLSKDRDIKAPRSWEEYPGDEYTETRGTDRMLIGFPEDDKKYLRVFYEVLERYPRERFRYEEEQIDILRDISRTLKGGGTSTRTSPPSTGTTPPSTGTTPPSTGTTRT
jgi:hypothetical protein